MTIEWWFAYLLTSIILSLSPGSGAINTMTTSINHGYRGAAASIAGLQTGLAIHIVLVGVGLGTLFSRSVLAFEVLKWAGAAYLIYLGITMLRARKGDAPTDSRETAPLSDLAALRIGFLTNALNPKTTLFVVSLFTQVIRVDTPLLTQLGYGAFMSLAHLGWFVLVAFAFSSEAARRFVATSRHIIERAIGTILFGLGIALATASLQIA